MTMKGELKIICEESENNLGFQIKRKGYKEVADWNDMSRGEQVRVLDLLYSSYELFKRFLKEE